MTQREFEARFNGICYTNKLDSRLVYDYLMNLLEHPIFQESYNRFVQEREHKMNEEF